MERKFKWAHFGSSTMKRLHRYSIDELKHYEENENVQFLLAVDKDDLQLFDVDA